MYAIPDELDSYMYQSVGHMGVAMYAEAVGVPLYRRIIQGSSITTTKTYNPTEGDEVEDLYLLLKEVQVWRTTGFEAWVKERAIISLQFPFLFNGFALKLIVES